MSDSVGKSCLNCGTDLKEPFISCVECVSPRTFLCLSCFARGEEKNGHKSGHVFEIIKNNFSILEPEWTARDELNLLDAIYDCGVGNWYCSLIDIHVTCIYVYLAHIF
uniref:ZZ-type domain-containing protein n=1 Tax=Strigamia maritima TaxID=126957 RepID=T1J6F9_STRMM